MVEPSRVFDGDRAGSCLAPRGEWAGWLHRGLRTSVMAWADARRPGRVYRVDP